MRWIKPTLRNSISALLSPGSRASSPESLEPLRAEMLKVLGEEGGRIDPQLLHRLQYASSIETLWFARAEMMTVLCALHGEAAALDSVQRLAPLFEGHLPNSLKPSQRRVGM